MRVIVDTREHIGKNDHILSFFDKYNIPYVKNKLDVGDYYNLDNPRIVVDRKKNIEELAGNVCSKDHERFKREIERAIASNIKLVILVETSWKRETLWGWKSKRTQVKGATLAKVLLTMEAKYGVEFVFAPKKTYGLALYNILKEVD